MMQIEMRTRYLPLGRGVFVAHSSDGRHWVEIQNFARLRDAIGPGILRAFCECFVGTDHLRSLTHLITLNASSPESGTAGDRNLVSAALLACGITREIARTLEKLRRLGIRGMLRDAADWDELEPLSKRWEQDEQFRRIRDKLGFHFDDDELFDKGIEGVCEDGHCVVAFESDGREKWRARDRIGLDIALRGLDLDEEWWKNFAARAAADHTALFEGVLKVFLALIESKR